MTFSTLTSRIFSTLCRNCGKQLSDRATFCPNCGEPQTPTTAVPSPPTPQAAPTPPQFVPQNSPQHAPTRQNVSVAWYLLPLFLFVVGGFIGYFAVKNRNRGRANGLLIFGIVWTIFWTIVYYGLLAYLFFP